MKVADSFNEAKRHLTHAWIYLWYARDLSKHGWQARMYLKDEELTADEWAYRMLGNAYTLVIREHLTAIRATGTRGWPRRHIECSDCSKYENSGDAGGDKWLRRSTTKRAKKSARN